MDESYQQMLKKLTLGIDELELELSDHQVKCIMSYLIQLIKWNKAYNLSGIKDPTEMVSVHLLDSLSVLKYIEGKVILDVGTGAGLPGFIFAICLPEKRFLLLDSNGKKTRFMFQTANLLGLSNIEVINERAENFQTQQNIDMVISRAFSSLNQYIIWIKHLITNNCRILAMKGIYPEEEIKGLDSNFSVINSTKLIVPGLSANRHLIEITRN